MLEIFDFFLSAVRRSLSAVILVAVILNLASFPLCSAMQAIPESGVVQKNKSAHPKRTSSLPASAQNDVDRQVANIIVDRIEDGIIYSGDGRKFEISASTRFIDNSRSHHAAKKRTAELFFEDGNLVSVTLK